MTDPDSLVSHPFERLLPAYADAQASLERIEERLRLSPVRRPWKGRMAIAERQALARVDGVDFDLAQVHVDGRGTVSSSVYDLTHWKRAIGSAITLEAILNDPEDLLDWLGVADVEHVSAVTHRQRAEIMQSMGAWVRAVKGLPPSPPLLHGGRLAAVWRQHAPLGRGDTVASLLIGDRWGAGRWNGSQGGLTALGLTLTGGAWKVAQDAVLDRIWLAAVTAGAEAHLHMEVRLRGYAARASQKLAARRRPGRLKDLLLLAMAQPYVTSSHVARSLELTSAGAIKLLTIATDEGLLLERSGQASYRSYAIPVSEPASSPTGGSRLAATAFEPDFWSEEGEIEASQEPF